MSDKNLEIGINVKGADAAAADLEKVAAQKDGLSKAEAKDLADLRKQHEEILEVLAKNPELGGWQKAKVAVEEQIAAYEKLTEKSDALAKSTKTVEEATSSAAPKVEAMAEKVKSVGEKSDESGPKLDKLINLERAEAFERFGQGIGRMASFLGTMAEKTKAVPELSEALAKTSEVAEAAAGGFELAAQGFAVGGPFGAAIGGLIGLMSGPLKNAFSGMVTDLGNAEAAEKRAEQGVKDLAKARQDLTTQLHNENLASFIREETKAFDAQLESIRSAARLAAEGRNADASIGAASRAVNGSGSDANQAELDKRLADIDAGVKTATQLAATALDKKNLLEGSLQTVVNREGEQSQAAKTAAADAKAAATAAQKAATDRDEITAAAEIQRVAAKAAVIQTLGEANQATQADLKTAITAQATAARDTAAAEIERTKGKVSGDLKGGFDRLNQFLSDNIPDDQQTQQIFNAIAQMKNSDSAIKGKLDEVFTAQGKNFNELANILEGVKAEQRSFNLRLQGIKR